MPSGSQATRLRRKPRTDRELALGQRAGSAGQADTHCFLLHARLLHAEGDLGVLVAEQDVGDARGWVARGV